ncbi:MAG: ferrous iron transport protein A [Betaproteobacteria bacterium]|nr:ferrous iron transport protein A [Betaproteobacteria bacterium]
MSVSTDSPSMPSRPGGATLASLAKDSRATITGLSVPAGQALADHVERLMELGFLPGENVRVLAKGFPSGDPIAVRIGQATFALRRFEAELIAVDGERKE